MLIVRRISGWLFASVILIAAMGACGPESATSIPSTNNTGASKVLNVVAAENFYGDMAKQLGGDHVSVLSILSDPDVDPHQYESSMQNAVAISKADLVIKNGADYDAWMDKLLSSSPNPDRVVITAADIANHKLPDNPHVWYGIDNAQTIARTLTTALKKLDSVDASTFDRNLATFEQSLQPLQQEMNQLKTTYQGTPVGLTETIFLYQSKPIGLNVLTPLEFEKAIAEGNDPPADTVATTNDQVNKKQINVLIYNLQTVTPLTTNLEQRAQQLHIPVVPVTETMPPGKTYQSWMLGQLNTLQQALTTAAGR